MGNSERKGFATWRVGGGAANTFNNKERVYSRAIAFSNRRCSVPLESTLPNISAMYIMLVYMYIALALDLSLTSPSLNLRCIAPFVFSTQKGVHAHTGGGHPGFSCGRA